MDLPCIKCGAIIDYDPEFCCNGNECGCGGKPIHIPLCSKWYDKYWKAHDDELRERDDFYEDY